MKKKNCAASFGSNALGRRDGPESEPAGFGKDLALEVIAIVAASTITNYTGSVTKTPLEASLQAHAWTG